MAFFVLALFDGLRGAVWTIGIAVPTAGLLLGWFSGMLVGLESGRRV